MRRYSAAYILWFLFLAAWAGHFYSEWQVYVTEQQDHKQSLQVADFLWHFTQSTLENWQSEFLQIITAAWVFKHFFWEGSPEAK